MNKFHQLPILLVMVLDCLARGADSKAVEPPAKSVATNSTTQIESEAVQPKSTIWESGTGEGFLSSVQTFSVEAGVAPGVAIFGSHEAHDLALLSLVYGHMWGQVKGKDHWYRGNWEARLEFFGGAQYSPTTDSVIGLTPHLRYNFATGTRWIPFFDAGAGVTATTIGPPDLSGTFEFNLQATIGTHWFIRDNLAVTGEVRYLHMSCAGTHKPNQGANSFPLMIGLTWFF